MSKPPVFRLEIPRRTVEKTEGWWIYYTDGTRSMDIECGQSAYHLGFGVPEVIDAMAEQLKSVSRIVPYWKEEYPLINQVNSHIKRTGRFTKLNWVVSGTSAVECAIVGSDTYWKSENVTYKDKILSYTPVWHGTTYLLRGLNTKSMSLFNSSRTINVDTPHWSNYEDREGEEARALSETEEYFKKGDVGAVIFNPIAWFNGIMPFSKDWWKELRRLCDKYDVLMICDDISACWGKVGSWHSWTGIGGGVQPDISAIGKSLSAGLSPVGVACFTEKVERPFSYGHTWCPSMGAVAATDKVVEIIKRNNLLENVATVEKRNIELAESFGDRIKGWRSCGCFFAIDFHEDIPDEKYYHAGLSTKNRRHVLKITSPINANEEYHSDLREKIQDLLD